jgi:hypothetical protein
MIGKLGAWWSRFFFARAGRGVYGANFFMETRIEWLLRQIAQISRELSEIDSGTYLARDVPGRRAKLLALRRSFREELFRVRQLRLI